MRRSQRVDDGDTRTDAEVEADAWEELERERRRDEIVMEARAARAEEAGPGEGSCLGVLLLVGAVGGVLLQLVAQGVA